MRAQAYPKNVPRLVFGYAGAPRFSEARFSEARFSEALFSEVRFSETYKGGLVSAKRWLCKFIKLSCPVHGKSAFIYIGYRLLVTSLIMYTVELINILNTLVIWKTTYR